MLEPFRKAAEAGQIVEVSEIKKAYDTAIGRSTDRDHGRIYRVLARHGWRKVMPRSKHPNKASEEACNASKKLTLSYKKSIAATPSHRAASAAKGKGSGGLVCRRRKDRTI
ncbi:MAG: winged helix-turn-helix domain-containing protein [Ruminiclostridium sp.]|nr:winged helix-turn-helix domain-containing protein [Ruminiclostridium sp.]